MLFLTVAISLLLAIAPTTSLIAKQVVDDSADMELLLNDDEVSNGLLDLYRSELEREDEGDEGEESDEQEEPEEEFDAADPLSHLLRVEKLETKIEELTERYQQAMANIDWKEYAQDMVEKVIQEADKSWDEIKPLSSEGASQKMEALFDKIGQEKHKKIQNLPQVKEVREELLDTIQEKIRAENEGSEELDEDLLIQDDYYDKD